MKTTNLEKPEDIDISIFYSFNSPLGYMENQRYVTDINIDICICNEQGDKTDLMGHANLKIMLLGLASNNEYSHYAVFDTEQVLFELGEKIYDFEEECVKERIKDELGIVFDRDIAKICYIEILPEYRKMGIAKKLIRDIYNRFGTCCSIFAVKPYPIQHDASQNKETDWYKQMQYENMEPAFEVGKKKLQKFYASLGFVKSKTATDYMFLVTELRNKKLDLIKLE